MDLIFFPGEEPYVGGTTSLRPIIAVEIEEEFPFITAALVDSGADVSIFHAEYAGAAGVDDIARGIPQPLSGIAGESGIVGYRHVISLLIAGRRFRLPVVFAALPDGVPNILEREGLFDVGPVGFDQPRQRVLFPFGPT